MRKTRLVILPGVRSLKTIGCLLLFLACPTIAFKGQENREVEPICNAQNFKEFWIQESPWPEGVGIDKPIDNMGNGLRHDTVLTKNTCSTDSFELPEISEQTADSRHVLPNPGKNAKFSVERQEARRRTTSQSRNRVEAIRENVRARRERVVETIRFSDDMGRTNLNRASRNIAEMRRMSTHETNQRSERDDDSRRGAGSNHATLTERRSIEREIKSRIMETRTLTIRNTRETRRDASINNRIPTTDRNRIEESRKRTISSIASSTPEKIPRSKREVRGEDTRSDRFESKVESITYRSKSVERDPPTNSKRRTVEEGTRKPERRDQVRRIGRLQVERRNVDDRRDNARLTDQVLLNREDIRREASLDRRTRSNDDLSQYLRSVANNNKADRNDHRNARTIKLINSESNLNRRNAGQERTVEREVRQADQARFHARRSLNGDDVQRHSNNRETRFDGIVRSLEIRMQNAPIEREVTNSNRRQDSTRRVEKTSFRREVRSADERSAIRTARDDVIENQEHPSVRNQVRRVRSTNDGETGQQRNRQTITFTGERRFERRAVRDETHKPNTIPTFFRESRSIEEYRRNNDQKSFVPNRHSEKTSRVIERSEDARSGRSVREFRDMEKRVSERNEIRANTRNVRSDNRISEPSTFGQSYLRRDRSVEYSRRSDRSSPSRDQQMETRTRTLERDSSNINIRRREQIRADLRREEAGNREARVQLSTRSLVRDVRSDRSSRLEERRFDRLTNNIFTESRRLVKTTPDARSYRSDTRDSMSLQTLTRDIRSVEANRRTERASRFDDGLMNRYNENSIGEARVMDRNVPNNSIKSMDEIRTDIRSMQSLTHVRSITRDNRSFYVRRRSDQTSQLDGRRERNTFRETRLLDKTASETDLKPMNGIRTDFRRARTDIQRSENSAFVQSFTRGTRSIDVRRRSDQTSQFDDRREENMFRETQVREQTVQARRRDTTSRIPVRQFERRNENVLRETMRIDRRAFGTELKSIYENRGERMAARSLGVRADGTSQLAARRNNILDGNTFKMTELTTKDEVRAAFREARTDIRRSENYASVRSFTTDTRSYETARRMDRISRRVNRDTDANSFREMRIVGRSSSEAQRRDVVRDRTDTSDSQIPTYIRSLARNTRSTEAEASRQLTTRNTNIIREMRNLERTASVIERESSDEIRAGIRKQRFDTSRSKLPIRSNERDIRSVEMSRREDKYSRVPDRQYDGSDDNAFRVVRVFKRTETRITPLNEIRSETRYARDDIRDYRLPTSVRSLGRDIGLLEVNRRERDFRTNNRQLERRNRNHSKQTRLLERTTPDMDGIYESRTDTTSQSGPGRRQSDRISRRSEIDGTVRRMDNRVLGKTRLTASAGVLGTSENHKNTMRVDGVARDSRRNRYSDENEILLSKRESEGRMEGTSRRVETRRDSRRENRDSDMKTMKFRMDSTERQTGYWRTIKSEDAFGLPQKQSYFDTLTKAFMKWISTMDLTKSDYNGVGATVMYGGIICYSLFTNVNKKIIF